MKTTIKIKKDSPSLPLLQKLKDNKELRLKAIRKGEYNSLKKGAKKLN